MGLESQLHKLEPKLRAKYLRDLPNINFLREKWQVVGKDAAANAKANGHFFTREMRPVEVEVVEALVPATKTFVQKEKIKAWQWVLKQDWGRELSGGSDDASGVKG